MICIVGGGIAGLYAALLCADKYPHRPIEVHEASGRWGGHIQTYYGSDYRYETGAGRFNSKHHLLNGLIKRFGLTVQPIQGKKHYCGDDGAPEMSLEEVWKHPKGTMMERQGMTFGEYIDRMYSSAIRQKLQAAFGYDAEFNKMNAADALRLFQTDFRSTIQYFSLKEGLSALVERIVEELASRPQVKLILHSALKSWEWRAPGTFHLTFQHKVVESQVLFLAVPKKALQGMTWPKTERIQEALEAVEAVSLHRLYGKYYTNSFYPIERRTIGAAFPGALSIRQYIPVNPTKRIAMVSYCDTENADAWKQLYDADQDACKKHMEKTLDALQMTCDKTTVHTATRLRWLRSYYWPEGVHVWRPGVSSKTLGNRIRHPLGATVPCFIVGESYSALQGWIEGALWTVYRVCENDKYLPKE